MAVTTNSLITHLDELLDANQFSDYCPNGLQVEGTDTVVNLVTGVTASQALIERAIALKADALLVHHGFFWKGESPCISGIKQRRIKALLAHNINLIGYHLPLDAHPQLGNNAQLAELLGITVKSGLDPSDVRPVGNIGILNPPLAAEEFCQRVEQVLGRKPLLVAAGDQLIETIGWCTGAAQGYIDKAAAQGVDAYLSGEISEPTVHSARELGVHYIAAGHHATERYGVQAVGEYLAERFGLSHHFVDIDNPA
jgi:dinuclear metal center YbgI/SA1388 family protein